VAARIKLVALQPIDHDGKPVAVGETFEVTEAQAAQLVASSSAETPASAKARASAGGDEAAQG